MATSFTSLLSFFLHLFFFLLFVKIHWKRFPRDKVVIISKNCKFVMFEWSKLYWLFTVLLDFKHRINSFIPHNFDVKKKFIFETAVADAAVTDLNMWNEISESHFNSIRFNWIINNYKRIFDCDLMKNRNENKLTFFFYQYTQSFQLKRRWIHNIS